MREADEGWRSHQSSAARWRDGVRALARQALDRTAAERRPAAAQGAVGLHAQHREMVTPYPVSLRPRLPCRGEKTALYVAAPQRPSSSGLGGRPFTAETRVRFP